MKNSFRIEFQAKSENERLARVLCSAFVLELDPTVEEVSELKTAISEAVTNSIIHGYNNDDTGIITIEAEINENCATYVISDTGYGIEDIEKAREPLYSGSGDSERSGMGFSIMEAFMDELAVESCIGKGTKIVMKKRFIADEQ